MNALTDTTLTMGLTETVGMSRKAQRRRVRRRVAADGSARPPPPCYEALMAWRDAARDWLCTLFAFAVPNSAALSALASEQPIVEVGAGTGYWCSLLRRRSVEVHAFDIAPIGRINEYHGAVPPFTTVREGGADVLRRVGVAVKARTLFLCYPPPDTPLAVTCVSSFQGPCVAYVGEFNGDTASPVFEAALRADFTLTECIKLPDFGNTCYSLTLWRRKDFRIGRSPGLLAPLKCAVCFKDCTNLYRCVFCRATAGTFCSERCAKKGSAFHEDEHRIRLCSFHRPLTFDEQYERITAAMPVSKKGKRRRRKPVPQ